MKMTKVLASLGVIVALGASAAHASTTKNFFYRCSPGALKACASLTVTTTTVGTGTSVVIRVRNLQGNFLGDNTGGSLITRIGIVTPPITGANFGALTITTSGGATSTGSPAPLWFLRNPGGLGAPIELTAGIPGSTNNGGIAGCSAPFSGYPTRRYETCGANSWVEFAFSTSNIWDAGISEVAWLDRDISNGNAIIECGSNDSTDPNTGRAPREFCTGVTPEPVTMVLLGSGLASMGGFGFFRRRKNTEIENS